MDLATFVSYWALYFSVAKPKELDSLETLFHPWDRTIWNLTLASTFITSLILAAVDYVYGKYIGKKFSVLSLFEGLCTDIVLIVWHLHPLVQILLFPLLRFFWSQSPMIGIDDLGFCQKFCCFTFGFRPASFCQ